MQSPACDAALDDRVHRLLLAAEDPRRAAEGALLGGRDLDHGAVGRERAAQHREAAVGVRSGRSIGCTTSPSALAGALQLLAHGAAGDGERVAVEEPGVEQLAQDGCMPPTRWRSAMT